MNGQFIAIVILGMACILFAAAWLTERKNRKKEHENRVFFSRLYSKTAIQLAEFCNRLKASEN